MRGIAPPKQTSPFTEKAPRPLNDHPAQKRYPIPQKGIRLKKSIRLKKEGIPRRKTDIPPRKRTEKKRLGLLRRFPERVYKRERENHIRKKEFLLDVTILRKKND